MTGVYLCDKREAYESENAWLQPVVACWDMYHSALPFGSDFSV